MCARYEIKSTIEQIISRYNIYKTPQKAEKFSSITEVRPTDPVPVITTNHKVQILHWGLKVGWGNKPIINARSETLREKTTFIPLLENRCLVPATAYFEWCKNNNSKTEFCIRPNKPNIFSFAGLTDGDEFTIVTCTSSDSISHIHNRMPIILNRNDEEVWLSAKNSFKTVAKLFSSDQEQHFQIENTQEPSVTPSKQGDLFKNN